MQGAISSYLPSVVTSLLFWVPTLVLRMIPTPKGSLRSEFGAPAVRLDSLTAAGSWLVESDHQLVATATQNHGQSVTVLKASPHLATNCSRLCG